MWMIYITIVFAFIEPDRAIEENRVVVITKPLEADGRKHRMFLSKANCHKFMTQFVIVDSGVEPRSGWRQGKNDFGDLTFSHGPVASKDGRFTTSRKIGCIGSAIDE